MRLKKIEGVFEYITKVENIVN